MDRSHSRQMVRFGGCLLMLAALALCAPGAQAQLTATQTETHTIIPPVPSLAAVLTASPPPGVVLAVDAENTFRPPDRALPEPGASTERVGWAFDRLVKSFGRVTALAPPTMVVLNTHPTGENIYQGMPAPKVFELLLASLDEAGWDAITGAGGLGMDNLQTPDQRAMFITLLPVGATMARPDDLGKPGSLHSVKEVQSAQLEQSRLRLAQEMLIYIPNDQHGFWGMPVPAKPGAAPHYNLGMPRVRGDDPEVLAGVRIRAELPNAPKPGQLNLKDSRFRAEIPVQGLRTVGDLIARIGRHTHTELYTDPRLESLLLTVDGADESAPACDLLRAVALCVTGTFRNVGPAFVLTDDVLGIAARRQILNRFAARVAAERRKAIQPAEEHLKSLSRRIMGLPYAPDSLSITPDEKKYQVTGDAQFFGALVTVRAPIQALPPEQQEAARLRYDEMLASAVEQFPGPHSQEFLDRLGTMPQATLKSDIVVTSEPVVFLDVPGLDGPVNLTMTLQASNLAVLVHPEQSRSPEVQPSASGQGPAIATSLARFRRRACLAAPQSLLELDSILDAMPAAGLNELWIDVPSPGDFHTKNALPSAASLVQEAIRRTKSHGIDVLPVIDLLSWRVDAPAADVDYNVLGETSAQWREWAVAHRDPVHVKPPQNYPPLLVSPFAPGVQPALVNLQQQVVMPGAAGLVWRHIAPPGYRLSDEQFYFGSMDASPPDFGYPVNGRLQFLRRFHADPVDIVMEIQRNYRVNDAILHFENNAPETLDLRLKWREFREEADVSLLQFLYRAAWSDLRGTGTAASHPGIPLLMSAVSPYHGAYVGWDARRRSPFIPEVLSEDAFAETARSQSGQALVSVTPEILENPNFLAKTLLIHPTNQWDGIVLDLTPTPASAGVPARSSLENLRRLSRMLHPAS